MNKSNDFIHIESYVEAIDNNDINEIQNLIKKEEKSDKRDIAFEIYDRDLLTSERLNFIFEKCTNYLIISSFLIKQLIKEDKNELLDIIFNHLKFYDNEFIISFLNHYKNKNPIGSSDLIQQIEKYKISKKEYDHCDDNKDYFFYLVNACEENNENVVKYFIEHGADINRKNNYDNNKTILFYASQNGNEKMVKYLIRHGADINKEDCAERTPFFDACKSGNENIVNYLIESGTDINKEDKDGGTPLFDACQSGNENIVKCLVDKGLNINKRNANGETPLFSACNYGKENIVIYLVENGANINEESNTNNTPLFFACKSGNENIVKYLVEHGADVNKENREYFDITPLFYACKSQNENVNLVKYLIEHGANINKKNCLRETPFHKAVSSGNEKIIKYFITEELVDINEINGLHYACQKGSDDIVKILVEHGADVNKEDRNGETPLYHAILKKSEAMVKYLVEHGAQVNIVNKFRETPLRKAIEYEYEDIVKYLTEQGAVKYLRKNDRIMESISNAIDYCLGFCVISWIFLVFVAIKRKIRRRR